MPLDLSKLQEHLESDVSPKETALLLDRVMYDLVKSIDYMEEHEKIIDRYLSVMTLRNQFAMMDENLKEIWR